MADPALQEEMSRGPASNKKAKSKAKAKAKGRATGKAKPKAQAHAQENAEEVEEEDGQAAEVEQAADEIDEGQDMQPGARLATSPALEVTYATDQFAP